MTLSREPLTHYPPTPAYTQLRPFTPRKRPLSTHSRKHTAHWLLGQPLPTDIGSYIVERRLLAGPSYADYGARHRNLGHGVLLRHEHWSSEPANRDALDGLRRSRRLQAEILHPHILPVIDFFEQHGEWFSVFPRVTDARSLNEIITSIANDRRPPCTISEFVAFSAGVTDGLAAIHRAGFVHRTLGIDNVLVDGRDHVLLSDLGCATPVGADDAAAEPFDRSCARHRRRRSNSSRSVRSRLPSTPGRWASRSSSFATAVIRSGLILRRRRKRWRLPS